MELLDIHTHRQPDIPYRSIVSCIPEELAGKPEGYYSVGYHPWYLTTNNAKCTEHLSAAAEDPRVIAIGETGLDKLKGAEYALQKEAFRLHIEVASERKLPLVIHAVRSFNDILGMYKESKKDIPWIIHGFRGKKELAGQLLNHGFYISFGEHYQKEALRYTPADRLFLETDDSSEDISTLCRRAAEVRMISVTGLIDRVQENIRDVFFIR